MLRRDPFIAALISADLESPAGDARWARSLV